MTGVGGGSLMTPLLILLFGIHPATAVGTDLLYAAVTKGCGTFVHGYAHTIDWRVVRRLATGSVPMTILTLSVLSHFDLTGGQAARLISRALGAALLVTALALIFRPWLVAYYSTHLPEPSPRRTALLTVVTGGLLGSWIGLRSTLWVAAAGGALALLPPALSPVRRIRSIAAAVDEYAHLEEFGPYTEIEKPEPLQA